MPLMDVKIRDLMTTAAAALREGGELLLAHEIRGDMAEVFALLEKVGVFFFGRAVAVFCVAVCCASAALLLRRLLSPLAIVTVVSGAPCCLPVA